MFEDNQHAEKQTISELRKRCSYEYLSALFRLIDPVEVERLKGVDRVLDSPRVRDGSLSRRGGVLDRVL